MRKLFLSCLLVLTAQSAHAFLMDNDGIHTDYGTISWKTIQTFEKRLQKLERINKFAYHAIIIGAVALGVALIYTKLVRNQNKQADNNTELLAGDNECSLIDTELKNTEIEEEANTN